MLILDMIKTLNCRQELEHNTMHRTVICVSYKNVFKYDIRKHFFTERVVNL